MDDRVNGRVGFASRTAQARALAWEEQAGWTDRTLMTTARQFRSLLGWTDAPADPHALLGLLRCLALVVVLNLVDAGLTIWQVGAQPGFADLNPVVQALIAAGHPGAIAVLKVLTLTFAAVVLLTCYRRRSAQIAGRVALLISLWIYVHWAIYLARYLASLT